MSTFQKIKTILQDTNLDKRGKYIFESMLRQYQASGRLSPKQHQAIDNAFIRATVEAKHRYLTRGAYGKAMLDEKSYYNK